MKRFLIYFLPFILTACAKPDPICINQAIIAQVRAVQFDLEVACTDEDKKTGLMNRKSLPQDTGMIFVYDHEDYYAFWMKNTYIPLSIAFLDKNKKIVDIKDMKPHDLTPVATSVKAIYAIEMNLGWFTSNNIKVGDSLKIID